MPIARVMNEPGDAINPLGMPGGQGGGDLNGSQATSILHGQAGTGASAISLPRALRQSGTTTGVVSNAPLPSKPPG